MGKIKDFVNRDVQFEDETKEFFSMVRANIIVFMVYLVISSIILFSDGRISGGIIALIMCGLGGVVLDLTLKIRRRYLFHVFWFYIFMGIGELFLTYGSAIDMEIFILPVAVSSFFATYDNLRGKVIFNTIATIIIGCVYCLQHLYTPRVVLDDVPRMLFKVVTIIAAFLMLFLVCWYFSNTTQDAQIKLARRNRQLSREAMTDPLTGLPNRRNMFKTMDKIADQNAKNNFSCFCVAMGDIDFFKKVNDTRGHNCGDYVLKTLASMFLDFMKDKGTVCRWGGEEFFFYFPESNGDQIFLYMEQLRIQIEKYPFRFDNEDFTITMTFGVSEAHSQSTADDIVKEVDSKLYMGKERGRNRVVW